MVWRMGSGEDWREAVAEQGAKRTNRKSLHVTAIDRFQQLMAELEEEMLAKWAAELMESG